MVISLVAQRNRLVKRRCTIWSRAGLIFRRKKILSWSTNCLDLNWKGYRCDHGCRNTWAGQMKCVVLYSFKVSRFIISSLAISRSLPCVHVAVFFIVSPCRIFPKVSGWIETSSSVRLPPKNFMQHRHQNCCESINKTTENAFETWATSLQNLYLWKHPSTSSGSSLFSNVLQSNCFGSFRACKILFLEEYFQPDPMFPRQ